MLTRIYPDTVATRFPLALKAMRLTADEAEETDYIFFDIDGVLHCESSDEQLAFRFDGAKWIDVAFPILRSK